MLRLHHVWLVPAVFTLLGFGPGAAKVIAQTTYPFEATYNAEITTRGSSEHLVISEFNQKSKLIT